MSRLSSPGSGSSFRTTGPTLRLASESAVVNSFCSSLVLCVPPLSSDVEGRAKVLRPPLCCPSIALDNMLPKTVATASGGDGGLTKLVRSLSGGNYGKYVSQEV
ncbi:hypothetical protein K1719_042807 [Acacia pycnantha]|nr:hypothetical protein K1719_042807 [Acacia pycnantha]